MKINTKVLLTILIIGCLLIILTGCGNKENEKGAACSDVAGEVHETKDCKNR